MLQIVLSIILIVVFTIISGFHFYWLFGGKWGLTKVFPTTENQTTQLKLPLIATLFVALVFLFFAFTYLVKSELIEFEFPSWYLVFIFWFIPIIFILRAIGEFKYVGFFKRIKTTEFGIADTKLFSPLCLGIGIVGIIIQYIGS